MVYPPPLGLDCVLPVRTACGYPPHQDSIGYPPIGTGWGYPPLRLDGVPPPPIGRSGDRAAMRWAVCLLRSRMRTFFLLYSCTQSLFTIQVRNSTLRCSVRIRNLSMQTRKSFFVTARDTPPVAFPVHGVSCQGDASILVLFGEGGGTLSWSYLGEGGTPVLGDWGAPSPGTNQGSETRVSPGKDQRLVCAPPPEQTHTCHYLPHSSAVR